MEITEQYLKELKRGYETSAEQHKTDAIANSGAAQAIEALLKALSIQEVVVDVPSGGDFLQVLKDGGLQPEVVKKE